MILECLVGTAEYIDVWSVSLVWMAFTFEARAGRYSHSSSYIALCQRETDRERDRETGRETEKETERP